MWLHTRTDYKFGLSGFPLYEINMTTKSAKYSVINTIERIPTVKRSQPLKRKINPSDINIYKNVIKQLKLIENLNWLN